jgi:hypothetical protein
MLTKTDTPTWVWYLSIGFFGLGYPIGLFHLLDRRPQIIINEIGIFDRTTYKDFINWDVIQDAYPIDISGQKFVCLVVDQKYEPSSRRGKVAKSFHLGKSRLMKKLSEFILTMINVGPENRKEKLKDRLLT